MANRLIDDLPLSERIQVRTELIRRLSTTLSTDGTRTLELERANKDNPA